MSEETTSNVEEILDEAPSFEDRAMDKGWRPQEEWEGDPAEWRGAKEFVDRGELMDRISEQTKQLRSTKSDMDAMKAAVKTLGEHNSKIAEQEYKKAMSTLKSDKVTALEEDDYERIVEIDEAVSDLKESKKNAEIAVVEQPTVHPEFNSWVGKNDWYNTDIVMRGAADNISQAYMNMNPDVANNPKLVLDYVSNQMKEHFPHKFEAKTRRPSATADQGEPMAKARQSSSKKFSKRDLNPMQAGICRTLVQAGAFKSEQEYVDQLVELGEIDKQKGL